MIENVINILAENGDEGGWFQLLLPVIFVLVYVLSGIVKIKRERSVDLEDEQEKDQPYELENESQGQKRYKPLDQEISRQKRAQNQSRALPYAKYAQGRMGKEQGSRPAGSDQDQQQGKRPQIPERKDLNYGRTGREDSSFGKDLLGEQQTLKQRWEKLKQAQQAAQERAARELQARKKKYARQVSPAIDAARRMGEMIRPDRADGGKKIPDRPKASQPRRPEQVEKKTLKAAEKFDLAVEKMHEKKKSSALDLISSLQNENRLSDAFVLQEILSKPVSLRQDNGQSWF